MLDLMRIVWRRRLLVTAVLFVGAGLGAVALAILPRTYVAEAVVLVGGDPSLETAAGASLDDEVIESQLSVLRSRRLARAVIEDLALGEDTAFALPNGLVAWAARTARHLVLQAASAPESLTAGMRDEDLIDRLLGSLDTAREGKSYALRVAFSSTDPELSARVANGVADIYLLDRLGARIEEARRRGDLVEQRLAAASAELDEARHALASFEREHGAQEPAEMPEAREIAALTGELIEARVARSADAAELARLRANLANGGTPEPAAGLRRGETLERLDSELAGLDQRAAELSGSLGGRHPRMIDLAQERDELGRRIQAEQRALLREAEARLQVAQAKERAIGGELERLEAALGERRGDAGTLRALQERVLAGERRYQLVLERSYEGVDAGSPTPDVALLSRAVAPRQPAFPKPGMLFTVALFASFATAGVGVYLAEQGDRGFRTGRDVEDELDLPNLALLPRLTGRHARLPYDYLIERQHSRYAEGLRGVLATLMPDRPAAPANGADRQPGVVLLVTSSMPGEGKTSTALALGRLCALEGLDVLVLDADLRHPRVHTILPAPPVAGLAEVLREAVTFDDAVAEDFRTGLAVLAGNRRPDAPTRLLAPDRLGPFLAKMRRRYDIVIIDSAPLLAVADGRLLARQVDRILFVVRWQSTARDLAAFCLGLLREQRAKLLGTVLSQVDLGGHAAYGFGEQAYGDAQLRRYYAD